MSYEVRQVCDGCGDTNQITFSTAAELLEFSELMRERALGIIAAGLAMDLPFLTFCPACELKAAPQDGVIRVEKDNGSQRTMRKL